MSRFRAISAIVIVAFIGLTSVNVSAAVVSSDFDSTSGAVENFGTYIGLFIGPDDEEWFDDVFHIEVDLLATILPPSLMSDGLSIINPVFDSNGGLVGGQWVYSGPEIVTYLTFGRGPVFSLFEFDDGANTGFFDASTLLNRPIDFLRVWTVPAPIPLPAAVWLMLSGLVGVFGWSRRR